jgi:hypothetical protein
MKRTATSRCVAFDPTPRKNPVRVTINQQRQHHPRMILRLAVAPPIDLESANINPFDGGRDEINKVVVADPVAKIGRQQKRLRTVLGDEIYHPTNIH